MARPQKKGLDYFALDVTMNDEVHLIEAEHGLMGFAILIKLLQTIYNEGYFYKWSEREQLLFSVKVSADRKTVASIVSDCIKWGIFDEGVYNQYQILTSRRIQDHYFMAVYKRVGVEMIEEYLLIDKTDRDNMKYRKLNDGTNKDETIVTDVSNEDVSNVADIQSTHSIVKDSKEKESISDKNKFLQTLTEIPLYPLDEEKDKEIYNTLSELYPKLDLVKAITDWKLYKLDKPLQDNSNARSQINNYFKNSSDWGKTNKKVEDLGYIDKNPFNTNRG